MTLPAPNSTLTQCPVRARGVRLHERCWACAVFPQHGAITLERRGLLYVQGEPAEALFGVIDGVLRETSTYSDGRIQAIRVITRGDILGTESLLERPYQTTVEALTPSKVCRIPRKQAERTIGKHPEQALPLLRVLAQHSVDLRRAVQLLGPQLAEERLMDLIEQLVANHPRGAWVRLPLTRTELAELLGLARATVSRALHRMAREGRLEIRGRSVRVR